MDPNRWCLVVTTQVAELCSLLPAAPGSDRAYHAVVSSCTSVGNRPWTRGWWMEHRFPK